MSQLPTVVVGGGIIGLACAYELALAGRSVHVIDRAVVGNGSSWGNAGWVTLSHAVPVPSPGSVRAALKSFGRPDAPLYVRPNLSPGLIPWLLEFQRHCRPAAFRRGASALAALAESTFELFDRYESEGIDTTLTRPGLVHAFLSPAEARRTLEGQRIEADGAFKVPDEPLTGTAITDLEPALSGEVAAAYLVQDEGLVDPGRLVASLSAKVRALGGVLHEGSTVDGFVVTDGRVRSVKVDGQALECDEVVVASGAWSSAVLAQLGVPVRVQSGKGYSFAVTLERPPARPIYLGDKHVAVSPIGGTTRIAGTMEFSGNNRRLDWRRVEAIALASRHYLGAWFDDPDDLMGLIEDPWVGGRPMLANGLPLIDRLPRIKNAYVATAHGMLGVTLAPSTAAALTTFMTTGRRPEVLAPFGFERVRR